MSYRLAEPDIFSRLNQVSSLKKKEHIALKSLVGGAINIIPISLIIREIEI